MTLKRRTSRKDGRRSRACFAATSVFLTWSKRRTSLTYEYGLAKILGASGASDFRSCFAATSVLSTWLRFEKTDVKRTDVAISKGPARAKKTDVIKGAPPPLASDFRPCFPPPPKVSKRRTSQKDGRRRKLVPERSKRRTSHCGKRVEKTDVAKRRTSIRT